MSLAIVLAVVLSNNTPLHDAASAAPAAGHFVINGPESSPGFAGWLTEPTVFNDESVTGECPPIILVFGNPSPSCVSVKTMRSGFTGGRYGFDANRDRVMDAILTLDVELLSEVKTLSDGTYEYTWRIRNLGSGALIGAHTGPNGPGFAISVIDPLLGSAGADRLPGTEDDVSTPAVFSLTETSTISDRPVNSKLAANPTTERLAKLLVPLADSPTRKEQCKDDGWQDFGFANQGQCVSYVETGSDSRT